jgi:hypothetical protein
MSKHKRAGSDTPAGETTEVGQLLAELLDPRYQAFMQMEASERDVRNFLEASRQLFAHKPKKSERRLLKMPLDTLSAIQHFTEALVRKIDEIRQKGNSGDDPVQLHRLQLANLINDAMERIDSKVLLLNWLPKIWAEANLLKQVNVSEKPGMAPRGPKPDWKKERWAQSRVASIRKANPNISMSLLAEELQRQARKENLRYWLTTGAARAWLYRNRSLWQQEKTGS